VVDEGRMLVCFGGAHTALLVALDGCHLSSSFGLTTMAARRDAFGADDLREPQAGVDGEEG